MNYCKGIKGFCDSSVGLTTEKCVKADEVSHPVQSVSVDEKREKFVPQNPSIAHPGFFVYRDHAGANEEDYKCTKCKGYCVEPVIVKDCGHPFCSACVVDLCCNMYNFLFLCSMKI